MTTTDPRPRGWLDREPVLADHNGAPVATVLDRPAVTPEAIDDLARAVHQLTQLLAAVEYEHGATILAAGLADIADPPAFVTDPRGDR